MNRRISRKLLPTLMLALACGLASCESGSVKSGKVVLNEVLVLNENNITDDYGQHTAWIELFNTTFKDQDVAGWKIGVKAGNSAEQIYLIPKGDVSTKMRPRQHLLFWADGKPSRGTYHTSILLDTQLDNTITLYDGGDKVIDTQVIPTHKLGTDQSYARKDDGTPEWEVKSSDAAEKYVTPGTNNVTIGQNLKMEKFIKNDSHGISMAIMAMSVVFSALLTASLCFYFMGRYFRREQLKEENKQNPRKAARTAAPAPRKMSVKPAKCGTPDGEVCAAIAMALGPVVDGEVYAAIAMALDEENSLNQHDDEHGHLTLTHVSKNWNHLV